MFFETICSCLVFDVWHTARLEICVLFVAQAHGKSPSNTVKQVNP